MSRRIETARRVEALGAESATQDTYWDKVLKYIPAEIVAAWIFLAALIASATPPPPNLVHWIIFGVMVILTAGWIYRRTGTPVVWTQIIISTIAFAVWAFALGGPFETIGWYRPLYGSIVLVIYTLAVGIVDPPRGKAAYHAGREAAKKPLSEEEMRKRLDG
jgi:hypothetical protein